MQKAVLLLANGEIFRGYGFGYRGETGGEVVFNTSMTGYQEILTDPSYCGQIVTMTYPLIGNYGVNPENTESAKVQAAGFIVREASRSHSNWTSRGTIHDYLEKSHLTAIEGVDTRKITRILRITGAMNGIISSLDTDLDSLKKKLAAVPSMAGLDLVPRVTISEPKRWNEFKSGAKHVVAIDCGIKENILRLLAERGCNLTVVPATWKASQILELKPDGVFLSNGPGDPETVTYVIDSIKALLGKLPVFGICLGHQMLGIGIGGHTYKLKFGHRGGNQPVKNLITGKVEITSQNHGFSIVEGKLPEGVEVTHINLNDQTIEGISIPKLRAFSIQYHPESSPGPHDSHYLFDEFIASMGR